MPMQLTSTRTAAWRPIREGVTVTPLKLEHGRGTFLMHYEPGSRSPTHTHPGGEEIQNAGYVAGMAFSAASERLYVTQVYGQKVRAIDLKTRAVVATAELDAEPYTCVLSPDGQTLYVSLWGAAKVLMLDALTLAPKGEMPAGEHPNAMVLSRDGTRLFVACANTNAVWVLDLNRKLPAEQIGIALGIGLLIGIAWRR